MDSNNNRMPDQAIAPVVDWKQQALDQLKRLSQTTHGRVVLLGLAVVACYFPTLGRVTWQVMSKGGSDFLINMGLMGLAAREFWQHRGEIAQMDAPPEDRWMGYAILGCGLAMIPMALNSASLQALLAAMMLGSLMLSQWGISFFVRFPGSIVMLLFSFYPDMGFLANQTWRAVTPHLTLEKMTAALASSGLQGIGFKAVAQDSLLSLPEGAVEVASGCSGFDMAFTLLAVGGLMGIYYRLQKRKTIAIMAVGVLLALAMNIPRVMLLAIASVYWGKASFDFWHGPIGGQMFAMVLFTIFHYMVMYVVGRSGQKSATP
jgi:exosortase